LKRPQLERFARPFTGGHYQFFDKGDDVLYSLGGFRHSPS